MKIKFSYVYDGDETMQFYINDECISTATHGKDGWQGMQGQRDLFCEIARCLNCEVERI